MLLDALARAPAAAALVVAALKTSWYWGNDFRALRLAHPQLRDGSTRRRPSCVPTSKAPTPRASRRRGAGRASEVLCVSGLKSAALEALLSEPWSRLRTLELPIEDGRVQQASLADNLFNSDAAGPVLTALSQRSRLRVLDVRCRLSAASFKALVEAAWPALFSLRADCDQHDDDSSLRLQLGEAAFAGFPKLEELDLSFVPLGELGAELLARRRWPRLWRMRLEHANLGDAGVAALARGKWPALERLNLIDNAVREPPTLAAARSWAPALETLRTGEMCRYREVLIVAYHNDDAFGNDPEDPWYDSEYEEAAGEEYWESDWGP